MFALSVQAELGTITCIHVSLCNPRHCLVSSSPDHSEEYSRQIRRQCELQWPHQETLHTSIGDTVRTQLCSRSDTRWSDYSSEEYQWSLTVQSGTVVLLYSGIQIFGLKNWWKFFLSIFQNLLDQK